MEEKWYLMTKKADFYGIAERFHIDPVTARLIRNRDVVTDEEIDLYLSGGIEQLADPFLLPDMEQAVTFLRGCRDKKIRIIGDYDIDGVCATYILSRGFTSLGLCADTAIPERMTDGYGINRRLIEEAHRDGVEVIVTCDNGIAASEQALLAASYGMEMVVTDHHEVPYEEAEDGKRQYRLPKAQAVVDPKRQENRYPFPGICGAAVAFQLIRAMYGDAMPGELMGELLEFAALATVGDVMELQKENRILVKEGLKRMEHSSNPGLRALIAVNGLEGKKLTAYHIGFVIGPCINATGRLDSAERALRLFSCKDRAQALQIAQELKDLNDSRKEVTKKKTEEALLQAREADLSKDPVLVIYLPDCHESLAGIIAGRVRETFYRPTFVLTDGQDGVKGSGRSIEAYSMFEELSRCSDLLTRFGGHKGAAGLSMPKENIEAFRKKINELASLSKEDLTEKIYIDVPLPLSYVTQDLVRQFSLLEPFGNGNQKPVFAQKELLFYSAKTVGKNNRCMYFGVIDENGNRFRMTMFGEHEPFDGYIEEHFGKDALTDLYQAKGETVRLAVIYYPDIHEYGGRSELQFVIKDYRKASDT